MKIRLTGEAIARINHPKNRHIRLGLTTPLGCAAYSTAWVAIKANEWNGALTKMAVLEYLSDQLNMSREQMLEIVDGDNL